MQTLRFLTPAILSLWTAALYAQEDPLMQEIEAAWKARQEKIQTVKIEWTQKVTIYKGHYTEVADIKGRDGSLSPKQNKDYEEKLSIILEDEKIRYERQGWAYSSVDEDFARIHEVQVYDGVTAMALNSQPVGPLLTGTLKTGNPPRQLKVHYLGPLFTVIRPMNRKLSSLDIVTFRSTGRNARVNGRPCLELTFPKKTGKGSVSLWVDAERDYLPIRLHVVSGNRQSPFAADQRDWEYSEHPTCGWLPVRWAIKNTGWDIGMSATYEAAASLSDGTFKASAADFGTTPPAFTEVEDSTGSKTNHYMVREDGSRREFRDGENHGQVIADVLSGRSDRQGSWVSRHRVLVGGTLLALVALVGLEVRRRWRRRTSSPTT
jgi:hypothetical protein